VATAVVASDAGRPSKEERRRGENRGRAKKRASRPTGPKGGGRGKGVFFFLFDFPNPISNVFESLLNFGSNQSIQ
jgi:hypothetical protein